MKKYLLFILSYNIAFIGTELSARGMTTSYDYNAAIHESGAVGDKYLAAKGLGEFLHKYESQLVRSTGGPCKIEGVPESVFGGVRMAKDGTLFVFLHNTDTGKLCKGKATLLPGKIQSPRQAMYNIDQNGNKVLMQVDESQKGDSLAVSPIQPITVISSPCTTCVLSPLFLTMFSTRETSSFVVRGFNTIIIIFFPFSSLY